MMSLRSRACISLRWLVLFLLMMGQPVSAAPTEADSWVPMLDVLEDPTHLLTFDSVLEQPVSRWMSMGQAVPSFGFSRNVYWVRFSHANLLTKKQRLYVEVSYPLLSDVTLYEWNGKRLVSERRLGSRQPFSERAIQHRHLIFPVTLPASGEHDYYLRVESSSAVQIPVTLWKRPAFHAHDQLVALQQGVYYGLVCVMGLYSLFLWWQMRDRVYVWFVLFMGTFSLTQLTLSGYAFQLLWPRSPGWNQISLVVMIPVMVAIGCVFAQQALQLQMQTPRFHRLANVLALAAVMLAFGGLLYPYHMMIRLDASLVIIACLAAFYASHFQWWRKKQSFAGYFALAWSVFLLGAVFLALNKLAIVPRTLETELAAQMGSAIAIVLWSFALAERANALAREQLDIERKNRVASEQLLQLQQESSSQLEHQFRSKTRELNDALEEVQLLNAELTEISHTDQLTGARNRRFMDAFLVREFKRARRFQRPLSLMMIDIDHFKAVNDTYGHPVGDLCLKRVIQMVTAQLRRCHDEVCRYGGEEIAVIMPDTPLQGVMIQANRIREAIAAMHIEYGDTQIRLTVSIGVSCSDVEKHEDPLALITAADQALYQAKRAGRNRVRAYESNIHWLHKKKD